MAVSQHRPGNVLSQRRQSLRLGFALQRGRVRVVRLQVRGPHRRPKGHRSARPRVRRARWRHPSSISPMAAEPQQPQPRRPSSHSLGGHCHCCDSGRAGSPSRRAGRRIDSRRAVGRRGPSSWGCNRSTRGAACRHGRREVRCRAWGAHFAVPAAAALAFAECCADCCCRCCAGTRSRTGRTHSCRMHSCPTHSCCTLSCRTHSCRTHSCHTHSCRTHSCRAHSYHTHSCYTHSCRTHSCHPHSCRTHSCRTRRGGRAGSEPSVGIQPLVSDL